MGGSSKFSQVVEGFPHVVRNMFVGKGSGKDWGQGSGMDWGWGSGGGVCFNAVGQFYCPGGGGVGEGGNRENNVL